MKSRTSRGAPPTGRHFARNLDWNLLRAFHEIVQADGVSRAARRTGQKQPTFSMALKRLEDHIGARLCRRGPGGFKLTLEGELLAETCESMFGNVAHIPHSVANVATIVHEYRPEDPTAGIAVENVDAQGNTIWLADFEQAELEFVSRHRNQ